MQVFLVIWNVVLTVALVVIIIVGVVWNSALTADFISLQEWFEDDFEGAVKYYVDERMQEYGEIIVREVIKGLAQP